MGPRVVLLHGEQELSDDGRYIGRLGTNALELTAILLTEILSPEDKQKYMKAIHRCSTCWRFFYMPEVVRADREIAETAVKKDNSLLKVVAPSLRYDKDFVISV